ncbi:acetyltransferase [Micromonospora acroterricola]|uniref:Acetyltransferase n=1 Tax=Micromonospora acroterricola TaxID=2202421 RepID=A0A317CWB7_9ACTN|nr:acetyltransferase [Micromonospora acroterricola]PWR04783.1 acetyltransferase [Micromonospora acroterricola]
MTDLVIRPLVAGEEPLFDSMPDPLPQLRQVAYADGIAGGGYRPETTWVALRAGRVVGRAAWLLPPGAVGAPWLDRFDLDAEPEVGAALLRAAHEALDGPGLYYAAMPAHWRRRPEVLAVMEAPMAAARLAGLVERGERLRCSWTGTPLPATSGRYAFRPAAGPTEINALVARIAEPDVLTGAEIARAVGGVDLATDPLAWLPGSAGDWRVAEAAGEPVGLVGTAGDACYPLVVYLGLLDEAVRGELLAEAVRMLADGGAREVIADVDAHRVAVLAELERTGFRQLRTRVVFAPATEGPSVAEGTPASTDQQG